MSAEPAAGRSELREALAAAFRSSMHFSIASVTPEGAPHVTPIGSLLPVAPDRAVYFEIFARDLPRNLEANPRLMILGVNSGRWFWLRSLAQGAFPRPPAVRIAARAGRRRPATEDEKRRWLKRVRLLRWLPGYRKLWGRLDWVREVEFERLVPVRLGEMSAEPAPRQTST